MKAKIEIFLMNAWNDNLYFKFIDKKCISYLASLANFVDSTIVSKFEATRKKNYYAMKGFSEKIFQWQRLIQSSKPNFSSFSWLNDPLKN